MYLLTYVTQCEHRFADVFFANTCSFREKFYKNFWARFQRPVIGLVVSSLVPKKNDGFDFRRLWPLPNSGLIWSFFVIGIF